MKRPLIMVLLGAMVSLQAQTVQDGILAQRSGDSQKAREIFETILQKNPTDIEAKYRLALVFISRQQLDLDRAKKMMQDLLEQYPRKADHHYGMGAILGVEAQNSNIIKQGWLAPKIRTYFEKAVELDPKHVEARVGLVQFYQVAPGVMGGSMEKALHHCDKLIESSELIGRVMKVRVLEREKRFEDAEKEILALKSRLSTDGQSWKAAGNYYIRRQRFDEALESFNMYVKLRPDTADAYDARANGWKAKGDLAAAITDYQKALRIDPKFIPSLYGLGDLYVELGKNGEARAAYEKGIALDQNDWRRSRIQKKLKEI